MPLRPSPSRLPPRPVLRAPWLALLALAGSLAACDQIFGIQGGVKDGSGGSSGSGSARASVASTTATSTVAGTTSVGSTASSASAGSTSSSASSASAGSTSSSASAGSTSSSSSGGVLSDCVLLLHMDEASWSGAGAVKDSSGLMNDGTPVGNATTTPSGKFGAAGLFDGTTSWVDVPDSASLHATTAITYAAWVYPTGLTDGTPAPGIISKRQAANVNVAFTMFIWTANQVWVDLPNARFNSSAVLSNGQWYHLAVVYDGTLADPNQRATLYVNGAFDMAHSAAPSIAANTEDVLIGNLPEGGDLFAGRIDEVAIWTRALGATEIAGLYAATGPL